MVIIETKLKFTSTPSKRSKTDYIVLHHAEAATCTAEDIHRWHLNNGWAGFGYHFLVRKNGEIYRGRPVDTVGAQCQDYNNCSIGICAEGAYNSMDKVMPTAQKAALQWLVAELRKVYKTAKVVRHKDLNATSCPGQYYPFDEIASGEAPKVETAEQITDPNRAVDVLKEKAGLAEETTTFMLCYKFGEPLVLKLANAMTNIKGQLTDPNHAAEVLKTKAGLAEETVTFLLCYKFGEQLVLKLANSMGG